ncbi:MAG: Gfo/Idh/MocA family oxidoreductase [Candidatus Margulisiibacteriota bacterium]|nr:Gfo/Idh/MocA family oxidoreductase [Candidatus Margulisiibacteriota bacterium]
MEKLRFALLGCGRISKKHAEALTALDEAQIVAVCDVDQARAEKLGNKLKVPFYVDYDDMLAKEAIDVVNILTPSGLHAKHTTDVAVKYKKHIVCEKPMALTLSDADRMIEACKKNGAHLFVVKQNRYNLPVMKLKEAVIAKRFGKMVLGTVRVRWMRDQNYYDQDAWRGTWALDGGVFANQAAHHIDLLQWVMGEPEEVSAHITSRLVNIEAEDTGVAAIKFKNGALGVIEATTATRPKNLEGSISVLGEKGTVEIGGFAVNEMKLWEFSDDEKDKENLSEFKENPPNVYGFGHIRYLKDVIDCIKNGKGNPVDGKEGRKSLKFIISLYESAEKGNPVRLSKALGHSKLGKLSGK